MKRATETKRLLTAETPHGTFTRTTARPYTHLAVFTIGHYNLATGGVSFIQEATWSQSRDGALRTAESQSRRSYRPGQVLGVYQVQG